MNNSAVLHVCPTCFARFPSHDDLQRHARLCHRRHTFWADCASTPEPANSARRVRPRPDYGAEAAEEYEGTQHGDAEMTLKVRCARRAVDALFTVSQVARNAVWQRCDYRRARA